MNVPGIPHIDRRFSRTYYYFNTAMIYVAAIPLHWLLTKLGSTAGLIPAIVKGAEGDNGGINAFKGYLPSAQDVFVCTFAKSGTNWMLQLAHQIVFHGAGEYANIHDVVAWPDLKSRLFKGIPLDSEAVQRTSPERKRVIKTHLAAKHVPYSETARYLSVIRDPKEVFVSSYHFGHGSYGPLMLDLDTWLDLFLSEKFPMGFGSTWAAHTASYWALKDKPNVKVFLFREMNQDLQATVQQLADFLGATLSAEEMQRVIELGSFAHMRNIDDKFLHMPKENLSWGKSLKMIREGKAGNSQELLTSEQQHRIDQHCGAELKALGSDFPYDLLFGNRNGA
jgi:hypothetical protein